MTLVFTELSISVNCSVFEELTDRENLNSYWVPKNSKEFLFGTTTEDEDTWVGVKKLCNPFTNASIR